MGRDSIVGFFALILGLIYSIQAYMLPKASIGNPWAPVYFPLGVGVLMMIVGALIIARDARKSDRSAPKDQKKKDPGYVKLILGTVAACLVYAVIFNHVGFIISTMLFLGSVLFMVNGKAGWMSSAVIAAVFTITVWLAFEKILMINLP
jgi:putative tricarboxylic transport membrane protein